jgi:flagellar biogenesis protein FliO
VKHDNNPTQTAFSSPLGALGSLPFLSLLFQTGTDQVPGEGAEEVVKAAEMASSLGSATAGIDMTRYTMVCVGLVIAILAIAWGFRRVLAGNIRGRANRRAMQVVDMLPLGNKRQLAVVRCYDRTFVLGLGEREVNLVTELDADQDVEGSLEKLIPAQAKNTRAQKNTEEAAAVTPSASAPPKAGLFTSILATATKGIARQQAKTEGSGEARIQSMAQQNSPAALLDFTSTEEESTMGHEKPAPVKSRSREAAERTPEQAKGGGWVG